MALRRFNHTHLDSFLPTGLLAPLEEKNILPRPLPRITPKKVFFHSIAFINALTSAANTFMAGLALMSLLNPSEPKDETNSSEEITELPFFSLSVSSIFATCSFVVNYTQALDFLPKIKDHILSLIRLPQNTAKKKKAAFYTSAVFALGASISNAFFTLDTFQPFNLSYLHYPLTISAILTAFVMTFAVRLITTKQLLDEMPYFYSEDEQFLLTWINQLIKTDQLASEGILDEIHDLGAITSLAERLIRLFNERDIEAPNKENLEITLAYLINNKFKALRQYPTLSRLSSFVHYVYAYSCALMAAEIFGEKLAAFLPNYTGSYPVPFNLSKLSLGMLFSLSHILTYYKIAFECRDTLLHSLKTDRIKTVGWIAVNMGASLNLFNYYLNLATNTVTPPILPLPDHHSIPGLLLGTLAAQDSFNPNFISTANKLILPPPTLLHKQLDQFKTAIVEEKPIHDRNFYSHEVKRIKFTLFKSTDPLPDEIQESKGCFARLRRRLRF